MRTIPRHVYAAVEAVLVGCDDRSHNAWADHDISREERAILDVLFGAQDPQTGADRLTADDLGVFLGVAYPTVIQQLVASLVRLERLIVSADGILHPLLLPVED